MKKGGKSDTVGTVSFVARFLRNGAPGALTETSEFRKIDGAWVYWDREKLSADPAAVLRAPSVGRNDPCPCGSGKKFKKCCG